MESKKRTQNHSPVEENSKRTKTLPSSPNSSNESSISQVVKIRSLKVIPPKEPTDFSKNTEPFTLHLKPEENRNTLKEGFILEGGKVASEEADMSIIDTENKKEGRQIKSEDEMIQSMLNKMEFKTDTKNILELIKKQKELKKDIIIVNDSRLNLTSEKYLGKLIDN